MTEEEETMMGNISIRVLEPEFDLPKRNQATM